MSIELRHCIVFANGRKLEIPNVNKVIVSVRDHARVQHQASVDVTIENINQLKRLVRR